MDDQLGLGFDAPLPAPPMLRPMLARAAPAPFDSPEHRFEPVWGGLRVLVRIEAGPSGAPGTGDTLLVDEAALPLAVGLPEFDGLAVRVAARSAVLDAELVATDAHGRPDIPALRRRLGGGSGPRLSLLLSDLLHLDGRSLLAWSLDRRLALLRTVIHPADELLAVPSIVGEGRALHAAAAAQGLAGVRARVRASPYLPGVRSRLWRFIPAGAAAAVAGAEAAVDPSSAAVSEDASTTGGTSPVIALIRRLPLGLDEE
jgi:ATP-dependent DNA ligase